MDFIDLLRLSYLGAAVGVLFVSVTPALRDRFLAYGPRAAKIPAEKQQEKSKPSISTNLLDRIASWAVPHDYFWTFYALSTTLSLFWLSEIIWIKGSTFQAIDRSSATRAAIMSFEQVKIVWTMMLLQGSRRLYETLVTMNPPGNSKTKSNMHVLHWILGLLFYIGMSVAVWIEGTAVLQHHKPAMRDLYIRAPSFRSFIGILMFILASGIQHDCHAHLANLKSKPSPSATESKAGDYKLPTHPAFQSIVAPHYTAECLIYLALAVVGSPPGTILNWTLASALVFVIVNLGVTAAGTRDWYERRFGPEAVSGKWNMLPGVF